MEKTTLELGELTPGRTIPQNVNLEKNPKIQYKMTPLSSFSMMLFVIWISIETVDRPKVQMAGRR